MRRLGGRRWGSGVSFGRLNHVHLQKQANRLLTVRHSFTCTPASELFRSLPNLGSGAFYIAVLYARVVFVEQVCDR